MSLEKTIPKSKDGITRITICMPKDDESVSSVLRTIDNARGEQSRSQAIQRMLEYLCSASNPDTLKSIMSSRHHPVM